jgi:hypothetical protein
VHRYLTEKLLLGAGQYQVVPGRGGLDALGQIFQVRAGLGTACVPQKVSEVFGGTIAAAQSLSAGVADGPRTKVELGHQGIYLAVGAGRRLPKGTEPQSTLLVRSRGRHLERQEGAARSREAIFPRHDYGATNPLYKVHASAPKRCVSRVTFPTLEK